MIEGQLLFFCRECKHAPDGDTMRLSWPDTLKNTYLCVEKPAGHLT